MNFFWVITFSFAAIAMFSLSKRVEKQLLELTQKLDILSRQTSQEFTFSEVDERVYSINPCPKNPMLLENLSNVIWVDIKSDGYILIKTEKLEDIEDIITALNSNQ